MEVPFYTVAAKRPAAISLHTLHYGRGRPAIPAPAHAGRGGSHAHGAVYGARHARPAVWRADSAQVRPSYEADAVKLAGTITSEITSIPRTFVTLSKLSGSVPASTRTTRTFGSLSALR